MRPICLLGFRAELVRAGALSPTLCLGNPRDAASRDCREMTRNSKMKIFTAKLFTWTAVLGLALSLAATPALAKKKKKAAAGDDATATQTDSTTTKSKKKSKKAAASDATAPAAAST